LDDQQARRVRLPLLGKGAVSAHRFEHPLAAEMDESEQRPRRGAGEGTAAPLTSGRLDWPRARARDGRSASIAPRRAPTTAVTLQCNRELAGGADASSSCMPVVWGAVLHGLALGGEAGAQRGARLHAACLALTGP
jgi:hypothetical protein